MKDIQWKNIELVTKGITAFVYVINIHKDGKDYQYIGSRSVYIGWKKYIGSSRRVKEDSDYITSKEILEVFTTAEEAFKREQELIIELDAVNSDKFYNVKSSLKFTAIGNVISDEHKKKVGEAAKNMTNEHRTKLTMSRKGKPNTDDHRARISMSISKGVEDLTTGIIYENSLKASQATGVGASTIRSHTCGKVKNPRFKHV